MFNHNFYATRLVGAVTKSIQPERLLDLPDDSLLEIVKYVAVSEMINLSMELINKREENLNSLGLTQTEESINLTFNDVGTNLMDNTVLNKAIDMLKELRQNSP